MQKKMRLFEFLFNNVACMVFSELLNALYMGFFNSTLNFYKVLTHKFRAQPDSITHKI